MKTDDLDFTDPEDEENPAMCPSCGAEVPYHMGVLGSLVHYRCYWCGWQWAEKATTTTGEAKCLK